MTAEPTTCPRSRCTTCGPTLYKRLTLVAREARIEHVFYPVFPPDEDAADVLRWLAGAPSNRGTDARS